MIGPEEVIAFWIDEVGPEGWYAGGEELDGRIAERFSDACDAALDGGFDDWQCRPEGSLALLILLDQFPRNIHRGSARAFAADTKAMSVAKKAIALGHDQKIDAPARQFFYLPMMHSERLADQDQCVRLMSMNMPDTENLRHAKAHREIIRQFGRFPYRNEALGRATTEVEAEFLAHGGYSNVLGQIAA